MVGGLRLVTRRASLIDSRRAYSDCCRFEGVKCHFASQALDLVALRREVLRGSTTALSPCLLRLLQNVRFEDVKWHFTWQMSHFVALSSEKIKTVAQHPNHTHRCPLLPGSQRNWLAYIYIYLFASSLLEDTIGNQHILGCLLIVWAGSQVFALLEPGW